ncbi:MAG: tetratricopeptide repeat protein [Candidatus Obscuribacterales bacterium]|nr:tetratricopeptide repeat protein [Candidatus Obscuribacterales bacterium]
MKKPICFSVALVASICSGVPSFGLDGGVAFNETLDAANSALKNGEFNQAKTLFDQSLKNSNQSAETKSMQWKAWKGLGEADLGIGDFKQSLSELNKALKLVIKEKGVDSIEEASVLDSLAWARQATGATQQALDQSREALAMRTAKLPADSLDLADSLEHVGYLYELSKLWDAAQSSYIKAAAIREKTAPGSMQYADVVERIAYVSFMAGKQEVAARYYQQAIAAKEAKDEVHRQFSPGALDDRTVFRSLQGAPNCMRGVRDGNPIERITANGMIVESSLSPQKDEFSNSVEARVRFTNRSSSPVQVLGDRSSVLTLRPQIKRLDAIEARDLAAKVEKKGEKKAKLIRFFGENATTTITSTQWGYGPPSFGYLPPVYGAAPPAVWAGRGRNWNRNWNSNNWNQQTVMTSVPDYQAREEARRRAAETEAKSAQKAEDLRQNALDNMTIMPGQSVDGVLEFEPAKFSEALLRIPVGNAFFDFLFD